MVWTQVLPDWRSLSLERQVAQLVVVRASGHWFDSQIAYPQWEAKAATLRHWIEELGVGGVILLGGSAVEVTLRTQQLQDWAEIPLLIAADLEEGVGQRFGGAVWMPPPMALGAIAQGNLSLAQDYAYRWGRLTAQESLALGINWIFAPVVDVNNNPHNPVINVRAFGETPDTVAALAAAWIGGTQGQGVLTTAKHFPGHGDTATDSHVALPLLPHDRPRLEALEWVPFRAAIAAGVSAIMTAHVQVPSLDPQDPATLSPGVLRGILREEWGFEGLIVTDALTMHAITDRYGSAEAPVRAVEAGADVVLMPVDPPQAIAAIVAAVRQGRIPEEQIHASLDRLWGAKLSVCSPVEGSSVCHSWDWEQSPTGQLEQVGQGAGVDLCRSILRDSLRVQAPAMVAGGGDPGMDGWGAEPLPGASRVNFVLVDNLLLASFRGYLGMHTPAIALPQAWGYDLRWHDRQSPGLPDLGQFKPGQRVLVQLFMRGNPFQGSAGLASEIYPWLEGLIQGGYLQGLVVYGSPYVWERLAPGLPLAVPGVFTYGQMAAAQELALGTLEPWLNPRLAEGLITPFTT